VGCGTRIDWHALPVFGPEILKCFHSAAITAKEVLVNYEEDVRPLSFLDKLSDTVGKITREMKLEPEYGEFFHGEVEEIVES
jgi:hypothetical protein